MQSNCECEEKKNGREMKNEMMESFKSKESFFKNINGHQLIPEYLMMNKKINTNNMAEIQLFKEFQTHLFLVSVTFEDQGIQDIARLIVPWQDLTIKSVEKYMKLDPQDKDTIDSKDLLVVELLRWFKLSFFSWFNPPECQNCNNNQKVVFNCVQEGTPEEIKWDAKRCEVYSCPACAWTFRFPRYNHPEKLLETRTGRCGEWAICFSFICRCLGFDTRLVVDKTDHVWTEIYSTKQKRWIHCDSCENAYDTPLVYEAGWGKKLSYCFAFSKDHVQDVTWRYTKKSNELLQRRSMYRENWIIALISEITATLQAHYSDDYKGQLQQRRLNELIEFIVDPKLQSEESLKDEEKIGRQSGEKSWKMARGEMGNHKKVGYVFLVPELKEDREFLISYNCSQDLYKLTYDDKTTVKKGFDCCVKEMKNIIRKIETDWGFCYLSRSENSHQDEAGYIIWELNISQSNWIEFEITIMCEQFGSAIVDLVLCSNNLDCICKLENNVENIVKRDSIPDLNSNLMIKASLAGGQNNIGWQEAQLFRQKLSAHKDVMKMKFRPHKSNKF